MTEFLIVRFKPECKLIRRCQNGEEVAVSTHPPGPCPEHMPVGLLEATAHQVSCGLRDIVIDLTGVPVVSATRIGLIVSICAKARDAGGHPCLVSASERVKAVHEKLRLEGIALLKDSLPAAERYFSEVREGV